MGNRIRLRTRNKQVFRLTTKQVLGAASFGFLFAVFIKFTVLHQIASTHPAQASSGTVSVPSGSFIIDMGITPHTYANGMMPYGLVYDLVTNYRVPVMWVIEPTKTKDGVDFVYNSVNYRGGPFVVSAGYIDATI